MRTKVITFLITLLVSSLIFLVYFYYTQKTFITPTNLPRQQSKEIKKELNLEKTELKVKVSLDAMRRNDLSGLSLQEKNKIVMESLKRMHAFD